MLNTNQNLKQCLNNDMTSRSTTHRWIHDQHTCSIEDVTRRWQHLNDTIDKRLVEVNIENSIRSQFILNNDRSLFLVEISRRCT
jgi:hypothetical protein